MIKRAARYGIAAGALAVCAGVAGCGSSSTSSTTIAPGVPSHFYEKNTSFTYTPHGGTAQASPPDGGPAAGSAIEFTDTDYSGTDSDHDAASTASDHFKCTFDSSDVPTCDGQIALDGSLLLIHGAGGQGQFTIPIIGGTGRYQGDSGTLKVADIGQSSNANLVVSVNPTADPAGRS